MTAPVDAIELRRGTPADLQCIAGLMSDAFDPRFGEAWTSAQCMGVLALPGIWLTIAAREGSPLGFALARVAADEAELLLLAVTRQARRGGVGGALLRSVICDARDRGARKLHLEVRAGNHAINLYQREGFSKVGIRPRYYRGIDGDVFDAHSFSRSL